MLNIRISIILVAFFLSSNLVAQSISKVGPTLQRDVRLIENYATSLSDEDANRLRCYMLPVDSDPTLRIFIHTFKQPDKQSVQVLSDFAEVVYEDTWVPPIGAHSTGFLIADVKSSNIRDLSEVDLISHLTSAYKSNEPNNDRATIATGAAAAKDRDYPLYGSGIRIAILDSGFDLTHGDLPQAADTIDYSNYPFVDTDVTDFVSGHGTHVAGTAVGWGFSSQGKFMGMAPDAEVIYMKIGNDTTSNATDGAIVGAMVGAATWADAGIATMSYGGHGHFNDGSSAMEQAVDFAVGQGVSVFISAGNNGAGRQHHSDTLEAGGTTNDIRVGVVDWAPNNLNWSLIMSWYDGLDESILLTAQIFDANMNELGYDTLEQVTSPRGTEAIEYPMLDPVPNNGDEIFIRVTNHSDQDIRYHLWLYSPWEAAKSSLQHYDRNYTTGTPSNADSAISVAAYTTRHIWTNYHGETDTLTTHTEKIAFFSSLGPRIDGYQKPNIAAPGEALISCRDTNVELPGNTGSDYFIVSDEGEEGDPGVYIVKWGTSMSCPSAAGSAALILEANPDLEPFELRDLIFRSAVVDTFVGDVPNYTWGYGKINVISALGVDLNPDLEPETVTSFQILEAYPNPFNGSIKVDVNFTAVGTYSYDIIDLTGRSLVSESWNVHQAGVSSLTLSSGVLGLPAGGYFFRLAREDENLTKRFVLLP